MINPVASEVGSAVDAAIKTAGRTKVSVSDESGIPYPTLNRKVAGKSEFSFTELLLIAECLEVSPATFVPSAFLPLAVAS
ncbi:helix-turn-helix domain-containing protein [Microbacterium sp. NPDC087592]|uniref:helix-turn-helix domain-containing protein n=1 Tax=Microbacterium sp. NPDC087592 TaxID=3364193 RepID=UPI00380DB774